MIGYIIKAITSTKTFLAISYVRMATIMHEFTHALGVKHTQARNDRDDHVTIMWDNIRLVFK